MRWLERLAKEKGDGLARDITVKQVRELGEFMGMTAALSPWRVAVIDSMDELNKAGVQRAPEDARGAARQHALLPRQPCARAAASDHPFALPPPAFRSRSTMTP